ncbi:hypothetical protein DFH09DRAFT_1107688 [Mycena vulgaris]|nr:hypothetical protein DFH09DRAFT_1107688 [Mycena vulgaris]
MRPILGGPTDGVMTGVPTKPRIENMEKGAAFELQERAERYILNPRTKWEWERLGGERSTPAQHSEVEKIQQELLVRLKPQPSNVTVAIFFGSYGIWIGTFLRCVSLHRNSKVLVYDFRSNNRKDTVLVRITVYFVVESLVATGRRRANRGALSHGLQEIFVKSGTSGAMLLVEGLPINQKAYSSLQNLEHG